MIVRRATPRDSPENEFHTGASKAALKALVTVAECISNRVAPAAGATEMDPVSALRGLSYPLQLEVMRTARRLEGVSNFVSVVGRQGAQSGVSHQQEAL